MAAAAVFFAPPFPSSEKLYLVKCGRVERKRGIVREVGGGGGGEERERERERGKRERGRERGGREREGEREGKSERTLKQLHYCS